jgi:hypothetical protein
MLGTKYKVLYENLNTKDVNNLLLNILMIIRRIVYGVSMILLYPSPYIQVVINSIFSFSICFFIIIYKPYISKLDNFMSLYIEVITFLILSLIGAYIKEDLPNNLYEMFEMIIIILIYMTIAIPACISAIILVKYIVLYSMKYFERSTKNSNSVKLEQIVVIIK